MHKNGSNILAKKRIACEANYMYNVVSYQGGDDVAEKSRAEYFRERRKVKKQLVFMVDKDKAEALDKKLAEKGEGRTEWFKKRLEEEISK